MLYRILIVDDDADFRYEFREFMHDFDVIEAGKAEEAVKILKKAHQIDLIILDERLPGTKGTHLLKDLKRIAPEVPVVILTGYSTKDVAVDALRGEAKDFIEKPLTKESVEKIRHYLLSVRKGEKDRTISGTKGKIERARYFIERNHDKKLTLEDVAHEVCLSPKYLSRLFKETTGHGFNDYKLQLRIERAKKLLSETGDNIEEISHKLGYENPESFIRIFREHTGMSPRQFRDELLTAKRSGRCDRPPKSGNGRRSPGNIKAIADLIAKELRDPLIAIRRATSDIRRSNKDLSLEQSIDHIDKMAGDGERMIQHLLSDTAPDIFPRSPSKPPPKRST